MQTSLFPTRSAAVTQTAGIDRNNIALTTFSHQENRANDICPTDGKFYAPFDMHCVMHESKIHRDGSISPYMSVFVSDNVVMTPVGNHKVTFFCTHGGKKIVTDKGVEVKKGASFKQGDHFYTQGREDGKDNDGNLIEFGPHIHIDARLGDNFIDMDLTKIKQNYYLEGDLPIEDIFYNNGTKLDFENSIYVRKFTLINSGQWNGWIADGSEWYYYENGVKVSGWKQTSEGWFYLDPNKGNAMLTGWFTEKGSSYYFNPKDGEAGHKENYVGGVMLTGWQWIDDHWYLFGDGGVMQTGWVWSSAWLGWYFLYTSGAEAGQMAVSTWIDKVYYVGSDGKMYKDGIFTVDGVRYSFDNSGVATRL